MRHPHAAKRAALPAASLLAFCLVGAGAVLYVPPPREHPGRPLLAPSRPLSEPEFQEAAAVRGGRLYPSLGDRAEARLPGGRTLRFVREEGGGCGLVLEPAGGEGKRASVHRWPAGEEVCRREGSLPHFELSPDRAWAMYSLRPRRPMATGRLLRTPAPTPVRVRALPLVEGATEREWRLTATGEEVEAGLVVPSWRADGRAIRLWRQAGTVPAPPTPGYAPGPRSVASPGGGLMEVEVAGRGGWREVARLTDRGALPLAIAAFPDGTTLAVRLEGVAAEAGHTLYGEPGGLQATVSVRPGLSSTVAGTAMVPKLRFLRYREPDVGAAESVAVLELPPTAGPFQLCVTPDGSRVALTGWLSEERAMGEMEYLRKDLLRRRSAASRLVRRGAYAVWTARLGRDRAFALLGRESHSEEARPPSFRVVPAEGGAGFLLEATTTEPSRPTETLKGPPVLPQRQTFYRLPTDEGVLEER